MDILLFVWGIDSVAKLFVYIGIHPVYKRILETIGAKMHIAQKTGALSLETVCLRVHSTSFDRIN